MEPAESVDKDVMDALVGSLTRAGRTLTPAERDEAIKRFLPPENALMRAYRESPAYKPPGGRSRLAELLRERDPQLRPPEFASAIRTRPSPAVEAELRKGIAAMAAVPGGLGMLCALIEAGDERDRQWQERVEAMEHQRDEDRRDADAREEARAERGEARERSMVVMTKIAVALAGLAAVPTIVAGVCVLVSLF